MGWTVVTHTNVAMVIYTSFCIALYDVDHFTLFRCIFIICMNTKQDVK